MFALFLQCCVVGIDFFAATGAATTVSDFMFVVLFVRQRQQSSL